jgi:nucleotide-binding universal stress UspA family protein
MTTTLQGHPASHETALDRSTLLAETLGDDEVERVEPVGRVGRIVVGVDGSEASIVALQHAIRLANATNASVVAVSSWRLPSGYASMGSFEYSPEDDANAILTGAVKSAFVGKAPAWFTTATSQGNASDVLIEASHGASMLVVGSRGHGGMAGVLLGSVSALCAERAACPVLIIH